MNQHSGRSSLISVWMVFLFMASPASSDFSFTDLARPENSGSALTACATPSDDCWETGFHLPGVQGTLYAMARDSHGNLYVGGWIISAGGLPVSNLAMWDGSTWQDVGGGVTHTNPDWQRVDALALDASDNLYVGGVFDHAGTTAASNLAKWNGSSWEQVGGGVDGDVLALTSVSGGLYVGGYFSHVNGASIPAKNIAYRDFQTASWVTYGSGVDDTVRAMAVETDSNSLFVGGDFSSAGGSQAIRIARLTNSGTWEAVGGGLLNTGGSVYALLRVARSGGGYDLYVGGSFSQVGGAVEAHNIALWNGSSWSALSYGTSDVVKALLRTASGDLIAAGDFTSVGSAPGTAVNHIARFSSGSWSALGTGVGQGIDEVNALLLSGTDILAGGSFDLAGSLVVNNLASWNGSWQSLSGGLGTNNVVNILMADGSDVYVSGPITHFGSLQSEGLAKLSANAWSSAGSPASGYIRALVKSGSTSLFAGGAFTSIGSAQADYLAYWNGATWQEYAGGTNGAVNALVLGDGGKLFVGGEFTSVGSTNPASHIAMFDGTWHTLGSGLDGTVRVLALAPDGNLYAGGEFSYAGSLYVNHIARWDGSNWYALGSGLDHKYILALTFDLDNRLVAGGYFGSAGGKSARGVALWNGYEWSALGSGLDDGVGALAVDSSGYLYVGGDFFNAGGTSASHIARWDGFAWSPLGSGTNSPVFELAIPTGDRLVVGGAFNMAGGKAASYMSAYTFPPPVPAPAPQLSGAIPSHVLRGGADFWLVVNGSNFSSRSVVRWNGNTMVTTYISANQLKALIPAARIAATGMATVTVFTPAPSGGGSSNSLGVEISDSFNSFLPFVSKW